MLDVLATTVSTSAISGADALLVGAVIALANVVVKLVEALLCFLKKLRNGPTQASVISQTCPVCQKQVEAVHAIVARTDANGAPLVYGHRELSDRVNEAVVELRSVCKSNERLADSIDKLVENQQGG